MKFFKYQALGNDYLILPDLEERLLTPDLVRRVCDRHFGLGSDGILLPIPAISLVPSSGFSLRIFNPDGSEAEKSGNGLRIFARYLFDQGEVQPLQKFTVKTAGGEAQCCVQADGLVFVTLGRPSFASDNIPVNGPPRQVIAEPLEAGGQILTVTALSVGNPHCVVFHPQISPAVAQMLGPLIENHPIFPRRTNVQFVQVESLHELRIEIWERGAGYTLASGSSASAAAAAAIQRGYCQAPVTVQMPGGSLLVDLEADGSLSILGPAVLVAWGELII